VDVRYVALTAGAQELAAHLVVSDLGDENRDAGREESFKPLYDPGVDLLGVRVGDQPQRAGVQQDDVRRIHLAFDRAWSGKCLRYSGRMQDAAAASPEEAFS
jgi:hypothetical protein